MDVDPWLALAEKVTAHLPHGQALGCTQLAAAWCPLHGDCICDRGDRLEQDDNCPLHGGADDPFTIIQIGLVTSPPDQCQYPHCTNDFSYKYGGVRVCKVHATYYTATGNNAFPF